MSIYKLYGALTGGSENGVAQLDVQFDGHIIGMVINMASQDLATGETAAAEISFLSTNTINTNDSRGSLISARISAVVSTNGGYGPFANQSVSNVAIPVAAGERLYLHGNGDAGVATKVDAYLYVEDAASPLLRRRR